MYIRIQSLYAPIPSSPHSVKKTILCHAGEDMEFPWEQGWMFS